MAGHGEKFGRKMEEAVAALLTQRNIDEAAKTAGISTRTLIRWMKEPEFQKAWREARRQAFGQSIARLQQATGAAATTLLKIMVDQSAPASTRVRAAEAIFSHAAKAIEIEDTEAPSRIWNEQRKLRRNSHDEPGAAHQEARSPRPRSERADTALLPMAGVLGSTGAAVCGWRVRCLPDSGGCALLDATYRR